MKATKTIFSGNFTFDFGFAWENTLALSEQQKGQNHQKWGTTTYSINLIMDKITWYIGSFSNDICKTGHCWKRWRQCRWCRLRKLSSFSKNAKTSYISGCMINCMIFFHVLLKHCFLCVSVYFNQKRLTSNQLIIHSDHPRHARYDWYNPWERILEM